MHGSSGDGPSWSGWAWNTVTSILPVNWDPDWSDEQQMPATGHTIHMGVYIDEAALTFKVMNFIIDQNSHLVQLSQKKKISCKRTLG